MDNLELLKLFYEERFKKDIKEDFESLDDIFLKSMANTHNFAWFKFRKACQELGNKIINSLKKFYRK